MPADRLVVGEQLVAGARGRHVPARLGVVEQRRAAAPAVRVGVLVDLLAEEQAAGVEVVDQRAGHLGVLDEAALEADDAPVELPVRGDRVVEGAVPGRVEDVVLDGDRVVVLAEGGGDVDEAGAVLGGDELAGDHREAAGLAVVESEDRPFVVPTDQLTAREAIDDLNALSQHALYQRLGQNQGLLADPRFHVGDVGRHGNRDVARKRPGRRRPDQERLAGLTPVLAEQRKTHIYGGVLYVPVAKRDLVRGERRSTTRAVGHDLVALVEQVLLPELGERPPDRLDVVVVQGDVGVVEVDPEADPLGQPVPLLDVLEDRLAAAPVELGDAVFLDLLLGGDPKLLLDLELDRQPVAVPARLARHPVAAHRAVARVDVLEDPREDVVRAGLAVGRRRPLVEAPDLGPLAVVERALEHVALAPARQHPLLQLGEGLLRVDGAEAGHERVILGAGTLRAACPSST